jgi:hypothetical protein
MNKTLGGASFVYNGIKQDYNYIETLECLYALCDELSLCFGGDDGTIEAIHEWYQTKDWSKKRLLLTEFEKEDWDAQIGREKLSYFSNLAIQRLTTTHVFYLQADEILHQDSFNAVRTAINTMDVPAFMVTRFNLWGSPYTMLNVPQERKPCSTEVIRLAKNYARCVGDAESLGCVPLCTDQFVKEIRIYHMGFVRDSMKHLEKIRHIQDEVFLIDHDKRIDTMTSGFEPWVMFSPEDVIPIPEELPVFIQEWAKERAKQ